MPMTRYRANVSYRYTCISGQIFGKCIGIGVGSHDDEKIYDEEVIDIDA